jgi:antitoxin HicB
MVYREKIQTGERAYSAVFEPAEEGGYLVRFPAIAHLATEGRTLDEARTMAADCLQGYLETLRELGRPIPIEEAQQIKMT